ncbi:MAG: Ppx/GppA family phosphatase [Verrucomicrobia bacterium]|jgi:exopolyphosphatase/guanosine-5'-triphosphate,3'-diphosphate pyrophosphatase|nr:Ppx/GppA family phosphatase [Verrucomicrobiota bacterium]
MNSRPASARRAVIDVGTNSVKLLVAEVACDAIRPVLETSEQTRLGRDFYESHVLRPEAIGRTAAVVAKFARQARELGASDVRPFATSAARDARNAQELVSAIQDASGLDLTIISGDTEAEWAFQGAASHPALGGRAFLLMDVGGGSTEFILGGGGHRHFAASFPLGTVRTIESFPCGDPPTPAELALCRQRSNDFLRSKVWSLLQGPLEQERTRAVDPILLAATGGTASILAAMEARLTSFDRDRIESVRLTLAMVRGWVERLWAMPLSERRQVPGLPPPRADVILAGVVIFEAVMQQFGFDQLQVSTRGLRFAALRELWGSLSAGAGQISEA